MTSTSDLIRVTEDNLRAVKTLVRGIFPVTYSNTFYQECLNTDFSRVIMKNNDAIAIVSVKPEILGNEPVLYVRSLGVHSMFRESGIGSLLLNFVDEKCCELKLQTIMLHVQASNSIAIEFYQKRGFIIDALLKKYYQSCDPADAYVMLKTISTPYSPQQTPDEWSYHFFI